MAAVPIKAEYGPTLGSLLSPHWRALSRAMQRALLAALAALGALLVALVLTLLNATYSHGGRVPFSFSYKGLHRVAPQPGEYVRIVSRSGSGRLLYSFAVGPLTLAPYTGEPSGAVPVYASGYVQQLRRTLSGFVLRGQGKTRVNSVPAYDVLYTATVEGRQMYGRNVLLLPERPGAREGVTISMLTAPGATKQVQAPLEVGTTGLLARPLRGFTLG
jgi:hypothetical protein